MILSLEPYQMVMREFLTTNRLAYCTVGLGLGKTATTLSALNELFLDGAIRSALIVAPLRVARITWPNEVRKWDQFQWMEVEHLKGQRPSGKAQLYLINYERLHQLTALDFVDVVVFDEITRAKNHAAKRIKAFRPLLKRRHYRWGLTGTPRPNSILELFAQIRLLDDGERLGTRFDIFKQKYCYPTDYMRYNWVPRPGAEEQIYSKIQDITLTLRSSDYLDVADTEVNDIMVPLSPPTKTIYRRLEKDFLAQINSREVTAANAAVLVNKLLQVCSGAIYAEDRSVQLIHEDRIVALKSLIRKLAEPVIVGCQFIHEAKRICDLVPGAVHASTVKNNLEDEWNSGRIPILVADPRSLGHGLNLQQGGRDIIWFSPTWSRELYDQFNARVARKGQEKVPRVHRLLSPQTIDEVVVESLREKGDGQNAMLRIMSNYQRIAGEEEE